MCSISTQISGPRRLCRPEPLRQLDADDCGRLAGLLNDPSEILDVAGEDRDRALRGLNYCSDVGVRRGDPKDVPEVGRSVGRAGIEGVVGNG